MGTNFYHREPYADASIHIGKRSAAGMYCYDCNQTLRIGGNALVHHSTCQRPLWPPTGGIDPDWSECCLKCGKLPQKEVSNTMLVELGFSKAAQKKKTGVQSAASFSWAVEPSYVDNLPQGCQTIYSEYDEPYTPKQFLEMLELNCPIRFTHSIGLEFS